MSSETEYLLGSRWYDISTKKIWEKREWGWKFLGYAESTTDVLKLQSVNWDHYDDIIDNVATEI